MKTDIKERNKAWFWRMMFLLFNETEETLKEQLKINKKERD